MHKPNTFTDTIACAEHLVARSYADRGRLALAGRSAGGLAVGAVLNLRPDLFAAAVAEDATTASRHLLPMSWRFNAPMTFQWDSPLAGLPLPFWRIDWK